MIYLFVSINYSVDYLLLMSNFFSLFFSLLYFRCTSPLQLASLEIGAINVDQFTCPAEANSFSREIRLFRLFVVLFGVLTLIFMGFMVIYYLHKAKVIRSFGHKYQRMGSIHYVKDQTTDIVPE